VKSDLLLVRSDILDLGVRRGASGLEPVFRGGDGGSGRPPQSDQDPDGVNR
jgi:hypothetical protein